jgi:hypothetical protein
VVQPPTKQSHLSRLIYHPVSDGKAWQIIHLGLSDLMTFYDHHVFILPETEATPKIINIFLGDLKPVKPSIFGYHENENRHTLW